MEENNEKKDDYEVVVSSSINKAISAVNKAGVVIIIVPGEVTLSYELPLLKYDSDNDLHRWMLDALKNHVILLNVSDEKIQKVIEISRQCHFDTYSILDLPDQKVSGSAYSMVSSLPRILGSEIEMFGKMKESQPEPKDKIDTDVVVTALSSSASPAESPAGRFDKITRGL